MSKKLLVIVVGIAFLSSLATPLQAASYQSPFFSWQDHQLESINWVIERSEDNVELNLETTVEYQTKNVDEESNDGAWLVIKGFDCETSNNQLKCQLSLPADLSTQVRFRFTTPDGITINSINYQLSEQPVVDQPDNNDESGIFYSQLRQLAADSQAEYLSWQEASSGATAVDKLILQTRAIDLNGQVTAWSGNALSKTILTEPISLESTNSAEILDHLSIAGYDKLGLTYSSSSAATLTLNLQTTDETFTYELPSLNYYQLAQVAAAGTDETSAFTNLSFQLNTITGLHLGQTISFSQDFDNVHYQVTGMITDLKASEQLVTVLAWQGAIPKQTAAVCGTDQQFCFVPEQTAISTTDQFYLDLPTEISNLTGISLTSDAPFTLKITALELLTITEPSCLQTDIYNTCISHYLPLDQYYLGQTPAQLQYRIIYGDQHDRLVTNVYLHVLEQVHSLTATGSATVNYLRQGKKFDFTTNSRPYYWR